MVDWFRQHGSPPPTRGVRHVRQAKHLHLFLLPWLVLHLRLPEDRDRGARHLSVRRRLHLRPELQLPGGLTRPGRMRRLTLMRMRGEREREAMNRPGFMACSPAPGHTAGRTWGRAPDRSRGAFDGPANPMPESSCAAATEAGLHDACGKTAEGNSWGDRLRTCNLPVNSRPDRAGESAKKSVNH